MPEAHRSVEEKHRVLLKQTSEMKRADARPFSLLRLHFAGLQLCNSTTRRDQGPRNRAHTWCSLTWLGLGRAVEVEVEVQVQVQVEVELEDGIEGR